MDINYKVVCKEAKKYIRNTKIKDYAGNSNIVKAIYYILDKKYNINNIMSITSLFKIKIKNYDRVWEETEKAFINMYKEINSKTLLTNE